MRSSHTKDPLAPSKFWETSGSPAEKRVVGLQSVEGRALAEYFRKSMPRDLELMNIQRIESRHPWRQYKLYRNELYESVAARYACIEIFICSKLQFLIELARIHRRLAGWDG